MHDTHAILCFGKTLPGFDPLTVRRAIQHSFKCSEAEMNEMFSGTVVSLREALSADEAELWRQQLNSLGLKVMIDPPPLTRSPAPAGPDADGLAPHPGSKSDPLIKMEAIDISDNQRFELTVPLSELKF